MNVFVTGKPGVGKSTIIKAILKDFSGSVGGLLTVREKTIVDDYFGIYMIGMRDDTPSLTIQNRMGECYPDKTVKPYRDVIETRGVALLTFDKQPDLIVMDELGTIEKNCTKFQTAVIAALDSKTNVLGVIKQKKSPFLDSIRKRDDVEVICVDVNNRERILEKVRKLFIPSSL